MIFKNLSNKISAAFSKLKSKGKLSEKDIREVMREVRLSLLEADVNYKVVKDFTEKVTQRAIGFDVLKSLTPEHNVIKIVNEELTFLMGEKCEELTISSLPTVVLLCGLQGSGKTTHAVKLALNLKIKGHRPLLVACDVYRPAAIEQLKVLASKIKVPVFEMGKSDPVKISTNAIKYAKDYGNDVVLIDTAGRLQIDKYLMDELKKIKAKVSPNEILLVIDSMTGQTAVDVASVFNETLNVSGVILTKLDGDTRGGAALSIRSVVGKPIKFIGTGEKVGDLEAFHPDRIASRILGMGDVLTLIEEAQSKLDETKAKETAKKIMSNKLDLNDLLVQFAQVKKMGPIKNILSKIPGVSKQIEKVDIDDRQIIRMEAIIFSMTPFERTSPKVLNFSRKKRIASGSGTTLQDINKLLKSFENMKNMTKHLKKNKKFKTTPFGF